jgi:oxygen-dependent protoporphyrinogen oxidase
VIVATPAFAAADLLRGVDGSLAQELDAVPYASSVTVTLGYARADVPHPLDGFGFIVPAVEGRDAIAGSFSSVKYAGRAPADAALVRVFLGGAIAEEVVARSDAELIATARSELRELLGITAARVARFRYPRSMPHTASALERVAGRGPCAPSGLALAATPPRSGLPDCVHSGELAAERVMATIDSRRNDSVLPRLRTSP